MKKRIVALLLAGILTASLASCTTTKDRENSTGGTENVQTRDPNANGNNGTPIVTVTWQEVNETVYVTASSVTLVGVENTSQTAKASQMDRLTRVKIGSNGKSVVVKDNVQYTVDTKSVTAEDLLGEGFTTLTTPKTMYAAASAVNIRRYATSEYSFSTIIKTLELNETVTVIAEGNKWSKISYNNQQYFVFSSLLADEAQSDPDDASNYPTPTPLTQQVDKYVSGCETVALRKQPSSKATALSYLSKDTKVTVVATVTVNGNSWSKVLVPMKVEEGQSADNIEGFISTYYLANTLGGVVEITLDEMLSQYPDFKKVDPIQVLYATDSLNVRSTPEIPEDANKDNKVGGLKKAEQAKVVAIGTSGEIVWAMIDYGNKGYCFVSYAYLTPDSSGNPAAPSFEQLLATYSDFQACTERTVYAKGVVNCNTAPENQSEVSKKLAAGEAVTVLATGTVRGNGWYLFRTQDGGLYFAGTSMFNDNQG